MVECEFSVCSSFCFIKVQFDSSTIHHLRQLQQLVNCSLAIGQSWVPLKGYFNETEGATDGKFSPGTVYSPTVSVYLALAKGSHIASRVVI